MVFVAGTDSGTGEVSPKADGRTIVVIRIVVFHNGGTSGRRLR
jgi:hypothetical protein